MKRLLLPLVVLPLCLGSCGEESSRPATPSPVVTDTRPLGEGLKVIGYAFLGASVVITLGRLLR